MTLATVLGAGFAPIAPGTCGTAAAVVLAWALAPLATWSYALVTLAVTLLGVAAADRATRVWHGDRRAADDAGVAHADEAGLAHGGAADDACLAHGPARHDDQRIVIDEVAGYLVTASVVDRASGWALAACFVAFRALDIAKPPPVRRLERLPGGWGVVLDDVGAGVMGAILMLAIGGFGAWSLSPGI